MLLNLSKCCLLTGERVLSVCVCTCVWQRASAAIKLFANYDCVCMHVCVSVSVCLTDCLTARPNLFAGHLALGSAYALQQNYDEAIASFSAAICLDPSVSALYGKGGGRSRGICCVRNGVEMCQCCW